VGSLSLWAQTKTITGKITGSDDGLPIPGAAIMVKGTSIGTVTNADGVYSLQIPDNATTLWVSYMGMKTQEVEIQGRSTINVALQSDTKQVDEVVVTAMGISREKKSLGYSVQDIKGEQLTRSGESNVINTLTSKVAGVQVISSGGTPGASSKILIRGNSSFTGNNQPLIVVDGIPIDNSTNNTVAGDYPYNANLQGVNNSNRALDLNPDDIESVTVLKGPSAAALYGARAANGAIVYTTKRGKSGAMSIVYGINSEFNVVSKLPDEQRIYAQGAIVEGVPTYQLGATANSWGPKISSLAGVQAYNNTDDFFDTGVGVTHNLSITGGDEKNTFRVSFSRLNQEGIVPETEFTRTSARINADSKITSKLKASASASYTNSGGVKSQNGSNLSGMMLSLFRTPASWNLADYQYEDGSSKNYFSAYDNPYWSAKNNPFTDNVDRFLGNIVFKYDILPWLNASYKLGADIYTDRRKQIFAIGSQNVDDLLGQIEEHTIRYQQYYQDVVLSADHTWFEKLNTSLTAGGNISHEFTDALYGRGRQLNIPNFYNLKNATNLYADQTQTTIRNSALFFDAGFGWDNFAFINVTGRNEWSSTFGQSKNNFFYPSVSLSFVFSEFIDNRVLSFGKFRAARAVGGNSPSAYSSKTYYISPFFADGFTDGNSFPFLNQAGFTYSNTLGNPDLKPEKTVETELGVDLKFFDNRLGFEFTWYNKETEDILVARPIAGSSGFQGIVANSGSMRNRGVELVFNATPLKFNDFVWNIEGNFSKNVNEVLKLAEGVSEIDIESAFTSIASEAIVGDAYGALYATRWERNDKGQLVIGANGLPNVLDTRGNIGNPFPDWTAGLRNSFSYKGFTVSALLDFREGGMIWNGTIARMNRLGRTAESVNREQTYVIPGVKENGAVNDIPISALNYFSHYKGDGAFSATENAVFDGSWIRLRELSLGYRYNFKKSDFWFKFVELSLIGRNLWLNTDYPGVDPETSLTGAGSNLTGFDYFNNPGTKSFSIGLKFGIL
ncbi:MAG: SusC/RagA family TonB-linked outer membrane protein, partial [Bacteroidales bacterium]|nr:SusC/RagA family TonB-linked outer membrane protein [Bacteroidales bacterium]